jgi:drug/metabolite transporter (DMT)-like permease
MAVASLRGLIATVTLLVMNGGLRRSEFLPIHWLSGLFLALTEFFYVCSLGRTTAANSMVLMYTAPLWVGLFAHLFVGERTAGSDFAYMGAIFLGMLLFFWEGLGAGGLGGDFLAVVSGIFFAAQVLCLRKIHGRFPVSAVIAGNFLTFLGGCWAIGAPFPDAGGFSRLALLGVFQVGVAYYIYAKVSAHATSLELVMITMLDPILGPVWVLLALGERPGAVAALGGVIVVGAVVLWGIRKSGRKPEKTAEAGEVRVP